MADNNFADDAEDTNILDDELSQLRKQRLLDIEKRLMKDEDWSVTSINDLTFREFVKINKHVVVDMWAEWCGPCRRVAPVIEELSEEFCGQVSFAKCNTDESPSITNELMITAIPTLLFFSGGEICDRLAGAYPKENLKARIISAFQL